MTGNVIVALLSLSASLFLAARAWHMHGLSFGNSAWMAVIWALIIAGFAFLGGRVIG